MEAPVHRLLGLTLSSPPSLFTGLLCFLFRLRSGSDTGIKDIAWFIRLPDDGLLGLFFFPLLVFSTVFFFSFFLACFLRGSPITIMALLEIVSRTDNRQNCTVSSTDFPTLCSFPINLASHCFLLVRMQANFPLFMVGT